jgi:hypothetical protein
MYLIVFSKPSFTRAPSTTSVHPFHFPIFSAACTPLPAAYQIVFHVCCEYICCSIPNLLLKLSFTRTFSVTSVFTSFRSPIFFFPYPPHLLMYQIVFHGCCEYIYCSIPSLLLKLSFTQGLKWRYYNTYFRVLLTHRNTSLFVLSVLLSPCSFNRLKNTKRKCVELLMCYMRALSLNVPAAYFVARRIYSCSFRLCPPVFILVP